MQGLIHAEAQFAPCFLAIVAADELEEEIGEQEEEGNHLFDTDDIEILTIFEERATEILGTTSATTRAR